MNSGGRGNAKPPLGSIWKARPGTARVAIRLVKFPFVKLAISLAVLLAVASAVLIGRSLRHEQSIPAVPLSASAISVYFSPRGGCTAAVVQALDAAKHSVRVQAYSFTWAPIAKAIVDAKRRGVDVEILLDKSQRTETSSADFIAHAGIPTFIDAVHAIAHNKVMVIDGETFLTGSFNFTAAAEERRSTEEPGGHTEAYAKNYRKIKHPPHVLEGEPHDRMGSSASTLQPLRAHHRASADISGYVPTMVPISHRKPS